MPRYVRVRVSSFGNQHIKIHFDRVDSIAVHNMLKGQKARNVACIIALADARWSGQCKENSGHSQSAHVQGATQHRRAQNVAVTQLRHLCAQNNQSQPFLPRPHDLHHILCIFSLGGLIGAQVVASRPYRTNAEHQLHAGAACHTNIEVP